MSPHNPRVAASKEIGLGDERKELEHDDGGRLGKGLKGAWGRRGSELLAL
jgi:hypothetical protein